MGNTFGSKAQQDQLQQYRESREIDIHLIQRYEFILENHSVLMAKLDAEAEKIEHKKAELRRDYEAAPGKLVELRRHLVKMDEKHADLKAQASGQTSRIKEYLRLQKQIDRLKTELIASGLNPDLDDLQAI